jgi:hypothetical protein
MFFFKLLNKKFTHVEVIKMDIYDQVLPKFNPIAKVLNHRNINVVILGDVLRMHDMIIKLIKVIVYNIALLAKTEKF